MNEDNEKILELNMFKRLLKNVDVNHSMSEFDSTPLLVATEKGYLEIVKYLLEKNVEINCTNQFDDNPLIVAARKGYLEIVNVLLANGVDANYENKFGDTALLVASEKGYLEVVNVLLANGANINHTNRIECTALLIAAERGHLEVVKFLLANGADVSHQNHFASTSLILAAQSGHLEIVNILIKKSADVNHHNANRDTALIWATRNGYLKMVNILLANGADVNTVNESGDTALLIAVKNGNKKVINVLIENGANIEHVNQLDDTALIIAMTKHYIAIEKSIIQIRELRKENLLNVKKIINKITSILIKEEDWNYSKQMEEKIINIIDSCEFDNNPKFKNISLKLKKLLEKEFINNLNFEQENYSLLHISVLNNWQKLVFYLIDKWPININIKDNSWHSAWNYACLLLQKENAFVIKKNYQVTTEDKKFLKDNIDLLSRKTFSLNTKNLIANENRLAILHYYDSSDKINSESLESFKTEINAKELKDSQPSTSTYHIL